MTEPKRAPVKVFVSYAHEDEDLWAELNQQLGALKHGGLIDVWWDGRIMPGKEWQKEIAENLEAADLILLLVSSAFLNSIYCYRKEMRRAMARHRAGTARVVPVLLRACHIGEAEFGAVQGLPDPFKPVAGRRSRTARDEVWAGIVCALDGVVRDLARAGPAAPAEREPGPAPAPAGPVHNLPPRNRAFTGRAAVLDRIREALRHDRTVAVTQVETAAVTGLGGIGKTQAALEYAHRHAGDYKLIWWVNADTPATLAEDLQALAVRLALPEAAAREQDAVLAAVRAWLEARDGWLLVFDNADRHETVLPVLPARGGGAVLVTSRDRRWDRHADRVDIDFWTRDEAVAYLRARLGRDDPGHGDLADALGDLPLAIEQAAGFMAEAGQGAAGYLALFHTARDRLLAGHEPPPGHPEGVWVTWDVSVEAAQAAHPAAGALLNVLAFLAPDDIPRSLFTDHADELPEPLRAAAQDGVGFALAVAALNRFCLIGAAPDALSVHRLVQSVTRARLDDPQPWADTAIGLLAAAFPDEDPPPDDVRSWPACLRLRPHAEAALALAEGPGTVAERISLLLNQLALYLKSRAEYAAARAHYERAIALAEAALGPDHPEVAIDVNNLGGVLQDQGDLPGARACLERALRIDEAALGPDHPTVAIRVNNLGTVLHDQGDLPGARACFERALRIDEAALRPDHPDVAIRVNNLGLVLQAQGDLPGARACCERALRIDEAALGPNHPNVARDVNNLGLVLRAQGDLPGARACLERALRIGEAALGPDHPNVALRVNNLGLVLKDQGDLPGARACFERALRIGEAALGPDHPTVASFVNNLGRVLRAQGDLSGARACFERALRIDEAALGPDHPHVAIRVNNLGLVLRAQGDLPGARACYERALRIDEAALGPDHPNVAIRVNNLGLVLHDQGDLPGARACFERALAIFEATLGPDHPNTQKVRGHLAALPPADG